MLSRLVELHSLKTFETTFRAVDFLGHADHTEFGILQGEIMGSRPASEISRR